MLACSRRPSLGSRPFSARCSLGCSRACRRQRLRMACAPTRDAELRSAAPRAARRAAARPREFFTSIRLPRVRAHELAALCCAPTPEAVIAAQPARARDLAERRAQTLLTRSAHLPEGAPTCPRSATWFCLGSAGARVSGPRRAAHRLDRSYQSATGRAATAAVRTDRLVARRALAKRLSTRSPGRRSPQRR